MIFSNTAVRSLSSLLVVAMATTTPSGVGGATTANGRKLSKNSSTAPPTTTKTKCPSATLFYPVLINATIASPHIVQAFPAANPLGAAKVCQPYGQACIGDTNTNFNTLYADQDLTQEVATLASTAKLVKIYDNGEQLNVITASIIYTNTEYSDTNTTLNYGGYFVEEAFNSNRGMDLAVSGGTQECALNLGTIEFSTLPGYTYGEVKFNLVDLKDKL